MKNRLDILNSIKKVDTPYYLYAKILHQVSVKRVNTISIKEMVFLAIPCAAIVVIVFFVFSQTNSPKDSIEIAKGMHLFNNNSLY